MFTLVTRGPRDRSSLESCLCDSSPATKQRCCSDRHRCRYRCSIAECEGFAVMERGCISSGMWSEQTSKK
ncbi:unnamed protein product [Ranitomeya imitator]|uniref:Uncharacterized protein n=1 Tax=Ranitomeya imitator TaxID=111125 RepID=A0ABN9L0R5_9NEOB|nr:unnamed protein product [Ranitomeya imitator]